MAPSASSYSHPEGQSGATMCETEHDNCLRMAMLSSGCKHLCLTHCSFQILLFLTTAFNQRLSLVWGQADTGGGLQRPICSNLPVSAP